MDPKVSHPGRVRPEVLLLLRSAQTSGEIDHYTGKRAATRITESLQLEVTKNPTGGAISSTSMHNVSECGCSFWSRKRLERGEKIYLREFNPEVSNPWIEAFVTHCTQGVQGFLAGCSFQPRL